MEKWRGGQPEVLGEPKPVEPLVSNLEGQPVDGGLPVLPVETAPAPASQQPAEAASSAPIATSSAPEFNLGESDLGSLEASLGEVIEANGRQE